MRAIAKVLEQEQNILIAYLFGSHARGRGNRHSDVDVAVYLRRVPSKLLDYQLNLAGEFSKALGNEVDLSILNVASPLLKYQVIKKGKVVHCRDERERVSFESRALDEYLDFERISARYFEQFMRRRS